MQHHHFPPYTVTPSGHTFWSLHVIVFKCLVTLLPAGADAKLDDNLGRSALLEACYHGHDVIVDTLTSAGVRLAPAAACTAASLTSPSSSSSSGSTASRFSMGGISRSGSSTHSSSSGLPEGDCSTGQHSGSSTSWALQLASLLCNCVYECNLPLLRRLLRAGAPVDIGDYDKRTALHISAAEGNAVMVSGQQARRGVVVQPALPDERQPD